MKLFRTYFIKKRIKSLKQEIKSLVLDTNTNSKNYDRFKIDERFKQHKFLDRKLRRIKKLLLV